MTQRIKPGDKQYPEKLAALHQLMVAAMKCKQTADPANVEKAPGTSEGLRNALLRPQPRVAASSKTSDSISATRGVARGYGLGGTTAITLKSLIASYETSFFFMPFSGRNGVEPVPYITTPPYFV